MLNKESYGEYTVRGKKYLFKSFDKIENPSDAYFIGYMTMDGSYVRGREEDGRYSRMSLTSIDEYIVKAFKTEYCPNTDYVNRGKRSSEKVNSTNDGFELAFPSKLRNTFKRFGVLDYKPNRNMIGVPRKFYSAYILGAIDADGCFVVRHRRDCRTPRLNVHIVSSAEKVLVNIQRILHEELNISSSIYQRKNSNCSELRINDTKMAISFGNYIYSNLPKTYSYKKKKIFDSYIKEIS